MQPSYFILPNGNSLADIKRTGAGTLAPAILDTFYASQSGTPEFNKTLIPLSGEPVGQAYAIVRDPIDRFISSYAFTITQIPSQPPVDEFINQLEQQGTVNPFFIPQTTIIGSFSGVKYYDFAKGLDPISTDLGLPTPAATYFEPSLSARPTLTQEQIERLNVIYATDLTLYASISS